MDELLATSYENSLRSYSAAWLDGTSAAFYFEFYFFWVEHTLFLVLVILVVTSGKFNESGSLGV